MADPINSLRQTIDTLTGDCDILLTGIPGADHVRKRIADESQKLSQHHLMSSERKQGLANNLSGLQAELAVVHWAPGVVAVQQAVHEPADGGVSASVDVVAFGGLLWLEVKATLEFSVESSSATTLFDQCRRLLACASHHLVATRRPRVAVPRRDC